MYPGIAGVSPAVALQETVGIALTVDVLERGIEWLTYEMTGNNLIQEFVTANMFITANNNIRKVKGYVFLSNVPLLPVNGYKLNACIPWIRP